MIQTLNISTSIFALFLTVEIISIALAAAIHKLLADTIAAVVEPFDVFFGALTGILRKEAEIWKILRITLLIRIFMFNSCNPNVPFYL